MNKKYNIELPANINKNNALVFAEENDRVHISWESMDGKVISFDYSIDTDPSITPVLMVWESIEHYKYHIMDIPWVNECTDLVYQCNICERGVEYGHRIDDNIVICDDCMTLNGEEVGTMYEYLKKFHEHLKKNGTMYYDPHEELCIELGKFINTIERKLSYEAQKERV